MSKGYEIEVDVVVEMVLSVLHRKKLLTFTSLIYNTNALG